MATLFNRAKVFIVSKALGLFAERSGNVDDLRNSRQTKVTSFVFLGALVAFQSYLLMLNVFGKRVPTVMDLQYRVYSIGSLIVTLGGFYGQFESMNGENSYFLRSLSKRPVPKSNLTLATCLYMPLASMKITGLTVIMFLTKTDNYVGYLTFFSYIVQSFGEMLLFLVLSQMYTLLHLVSAEMEKSKKLPLPYKLDLLDHTLEVSASINRFYERQILFTFSYYFIQAITCGYYFCMYVFVNSYLIKQSKYFLWNFIVNAVVLVEVIVPVVMPISACEKINDVVDAFYDELFRIMRTNDRLCANKKLCLYMTLRRTVNFTACGFFNLGYPLVTSIIAAATTYLVILVQFSMPK